MKWSSRVGVGVIGASAEHGSAHFLWASVLGIPAAALGFWLFWLLFQWHRFVIWAMPAWSIYGMARSSFKQGYIADALLLLEGALRKDPGLFVAHFARALVLLSKEDKALQPQVLADLDRTIELEPGYARAYLCRARLRAEAGDRAGAVQDCLAALQITEAAERFDEEVKDEQVKFAAAGQITEAAERFDEEVKALVALKRIRARVPGDWFTPSISGGYLVVVQTKLPSLDEVRAEMKALGL